MNPIFRNILSPIVGLIVGMGANMGLLILGMMIIPIPEGIDIMDAESLKANAHLFEPKHFIFPYVAHMAQAMLGAFLAAKIAGSHKMIFGMVIAGLTLLGGIMNAIDIPAPMTFIVLDLVSYLPLGFLATKWGMRNKATA